MIDFPKSTALHRRIPKQKFYEHLKLSRDIEQQFVSDIDSIYWIYKLSPETMNISKGKQVSEIELFEISLKQQRLSKSVIEIIDREIPYHLVFILKYQDMRQCWISYKVASKNREHKFKVDQYYQTDWVAADELSLSIEGLDLDKIYEQFIAQIAGGKLIVGAGEAIEVAVTRSKDREKLEAHIQALEVKIVKEKQFNVKVQLNGELRKLKALLANDK